LSASLGSGESLVKGPYVAETFPVSVEEDYLVIDHHVHGDSGA
jgi:hypothetical protein